MRGKRLGIAYVIAALGVGSCEWERDASQPSYVTLQELDQSAQPTAQDLGVLVAVLASGGSAVWLSVAGGALDDGDTASCSVLQGSSGAFVVAVHPTASEAVITAVLGNADDGGEGATDATAPVNGAETADAGDATTPGAASSSMNLCNGRTFRSLGSTSTLVVSLGRAPLPPSAVKDGATTVLDASAEAEESPEEDASQDIGSESDSTTADVGADTGGLEAAGDSPAPSDALNDGGGE